MRERILFAILALTVAVIPFAVPWIAAEHPIAALAIRSFFSHLCHQNAARSFTIRGSPAAVCVRCLGIYCGVALAALLGIAPGPLQRIPKTAVLCILEAGLLLNLLDVAAETLRLHGNLPSLRFFFGLWLGFAAGTLLGVREDRRRAGGMNLLLFRCGLLPPDRSLPASSSRGRRLGLR